MNMLRLSRQIWFILSSVFLLCGSQLVIADPTCLGFCDERSLYPFFAEESNMQSMMTNNNHCSIDDLFDQIRRKNEQEEE